MTTFVFPYLCCTGHPFPPFTPPSPGSLARPFVKRVKVYTVASQLTSAGLTNPVLLPPSLLLYAPLLYFSPMGNWRNHATQAPFPPIAAHSTQRRVNCYCVSALLQFKLFHTMCHAIFYPQFCTVTKPLTKRIHLSKYGLIRLREDIQTFQNFLDVLLDTAGLAPR